MSSMSESSQGNQELAPCAQRWPLAASSYARPEAPAAQETFTLSICKTHTHVQHYRWRHGLCEACLSLRKLQQHPQHFCRDGFGFFATGQPPALGVTSCIIGQQMLFCRANKACKASYQRSRQQAICTSRYANQQVWQAVQAVTDFQASC